MTAYIDLEDDSVIVELGEVEAALVAQIPDVVASLGNGDDPAAERLHPPVAPGDPDIDEAWWKLVGADLEASRNSDAFLVAEQVPGGSKVRLRLDADEAETMLRAVNHARLIIAARMGVAYSDDDGVLDGNDTSVLDFLGWMVEMLTDSLTRIRFGEGET